MSKYKLQMNPNKTTYADIVLAGITGKPIIPKPDDILTLPLNKEESFDCLIDSIVENYPGKIMLKIGRRINYDRRLGDNYWSDDYELDSIMAINGHKIKSNRDAWDTIIPF